ncbi:hypothetical protein [Adhaeribacter pallidiroseus]|uniref:Uncharacterized protein n=1 Tax=Adhaeribacter pallidiroseus TaxID=2072847 RepID=A0A369QB27_9BACT|nr:hypothetical protein [Adhaeribacter pallidiroseus]RDC62121.1 hypothetical protein AHMF7616_00712 [Adhaeribacter pallidiroseus]
MATLEIMEESLVWLYNKHKENHTNMWDISQFVKSLGLPSSKEQACLELGKQSTFNTKNTNQSYCLFTSEGISTGQQLGTSAEIMALTLKVLAHLKVSKNEYFDLTTIPALQDQDWNLIGDLTKYLLKKNFVKIKGIDSTVYAQITPFGLQFVHACEATAC